MSGRTYHLTVCCLKCNWCYYFLQVNSIIEMPTTWIEMEENKSMHSLSTNAPYNSHYISTVRLVAFSKIFPKIVTKCSIFLCECTGLPPLNALVGRFTLSPFLIQWVFVKFFHFRIGSCSSSIYLQF